MTMGGPAPRPVASMTAFARRAQAGEGGDLTWELKSVNGKGLDIRLRCPAGYEAGEARFRALIGSALARGSIQATLTVSRVALPPQIRVNEELVRRLVEAVSRAVPAEAAVGPLTLDGILAVRGVVEMADTADVGANARATSDAAALLEATLSDLGAMRAGEGEALRQVLLAQLRDIDASIEAADQAPGRTPEAVLERLTRSVKELFEAVPALDPDRLHQEAMLLAMRADVREEIDRLRVHGAAVRALLDGGGAVGRRLDFLAQELAREANTLCAKSNDAKLTAIGLALRNQIEQFREQVQNLE